MIALRRVTMTPAVAAAARPFASHSPWGGEHWRHDKTAFVDWVRKAMADNSSAEKRQLYGFLAYKFGDADADKDGFITAPEFDHLLEKVASLPRRFGLAPTWEVEYGGSIEKRTAARKAMFDKIDSQKGPARGKIGMQMFVQFCYDHILGKVATLEHVSGVDFNHLDQCTEKEFVDYLEKAVTDQNSDAYAVLYEYLLTLFVEADVDSTGAINFNQFDLLVDKAAAAPRLFKLAPAGSSTEIRKAIFDSMDDNQEGYVTFRKFTRWLVEHAKEKIDDHRAGKGYKAI